MEEKEFLTLNEWGLRVARLMELIAMTNRTIRIHEAENDTGLYVEQYRELLGKHTSDLQELMQVMDLSVELRPSAQVA